MSDRFHMKVSDLFRLQDGRTVLTGQVEEGIDALLQPGPCDVLVDGSRVTTIEIHPEMVHSHATIPEGVADRAISTRDDTRLTQELVRTKDCRLEGMVRYRGHRHLIGVDSPPKNFVPDSLTYGPVLPEGWDGDAWQGRDNTGYFLRAWNKRTGRYAIGAAPEYEEARKHLLDEIRSGGQPVKIVARESVS
jgi:hypothetical protein